jgi:hypothetical protein
MIKILGRTLIILTAALVVVGATVALVGGNADTDRPAAEQGEAGFIPAGDEAPTPDFEEHEFSGEGRDAPSLFGIVGVIQNLVTIGLIIGIVRLVVWSKTPLARFGARLHNTP